MTSVAYQSTYYWPSQGIFSVVCFCFFFLFVVVVFRAFSRSIRPFVRPHTNIRSNDVARLFFFFLFKKKKKNSFWLLWLTHFLASPFDLKRPPAGSMTELRGIYNSLYIPLKGDFLFEKKNI